MVVLVCLVACSSTDDQEPTSLQSGNILPPSTDINYLSLQIVNGLVRENEGLTREQAVLVATPVVVNNLTSTNEFALQLQQGLIAALHSHQFNLVDVSVAENLRVTEQGELMLSRDWKLLKSTLEVEHVLVSTMSLNQQGLSLNSRIVNIINNQVVSATQGTYSADMLPSYLKRSEKVTSDKGMLYRDEQAGVRQVQFIGGDE